MLLNRPEISSFNQEISIVTTREDFLFMNLRFGKVVFVLYYLKKAFCEIIICFLFLASSFGFKFYEYDFL